MRVKLAAAQDGLPCIKPSPVIHLRAAVQKADKGQKGEGYRRGDKQNADEVPRARTFQSLG